MKIHLDPLRLKRIEKSAAENTTIVEKLTTILFALLISFLVKINLSVWIVEIIDQSVNLFFIYAAFDVLDALIAHQKWENMIQVRADDNYI